MILESTGDGQWRRAVPLPYYWPEISRKWSLKICTCQATFFRHKTYEKHWREHHG